MAMSTDSGVVERALAIELGIAPQGGERGAQLVGGIGNETAQPVFVVFADEGRVFHLAEHIVERAAQATELGMRVALRHTLGEIAGGNHFRGANHLVDRLESAPDHDPGGECRRRYRQRPGNEDGANQPLDRAVDILQRPRGDEVVSILARGHQQAVIEGAILGGNRLDPVEHGGQLGAGHLWQAAVGSLGRRCNRSAHSRRRCHRARSKTTPPYAHRSPVLHPRCCR